MKVTARSEAKTTVERSRFYALLVPCDGPDDVEAVLKEHRREHRKANHHCWAARWRDAVGAIVEASKDDGEVGHPGRLMLEMLRRHDIEGALVVSRIFGGVKLGTGGVSRAFREAAELALAARTAGA